jgi:hypothetical protein
VDENKPKLTLNPEEKARATEAKLERFERRVNVVKVIAFQLTIAISLMLMFWSILSKQWASLSSTPSAADETTKRITAMNSQIQLLSTKVDSALKSGQPISSTGKLEADVKELQSSFAGFQIALGDDPSKRLAVPILRKDMDALKESYQRDLAAIREEFTRAFDTIKWIVGLIGLSNLGLGVLGLMKSKSEKS